MSWALQRHARSQGMEAVRVEVEATRPRPELLRLRYLVAGAVDALRLPPAATPQRTDELWRTTCFEAFLQGAGGGYHEFNFAPSTRWAAYRFEGYRDGMAVEAAVAAPLIESTTEPDRYALQVDLGLGRLPGLAQAAAWRLGISAVLEEVHGGISYWALAHPTAKPDFHHPDSFALDLPLTDSA